MVSQWPRFAAVSPVSPPVFAVVRSRVLSGTILWLGSATPASFRDDPQPGEGARPGRNTNVIRNITSVARGSFESREQANRNSERELGTRLEPKWRRIVVCFFSRDHVRPLRNVSKTGSRRNRGLHRNRHTVPVRTVALRQSSTVCPRANLASSLTSRTPPKRLTFPARQER